MLALMQNGGGLLDSDLFIVVEIKHINNEYYYRFDKSSFAQKAKSKTLTQTINEIEENGKMKMIGWWQSE